MKKSTQLAFLTWLLVGTLTSAAAAQSIESETSSSPLTADGIANDTEILTETELRSQILPNSAEEAAAETQQKETENQESSTAGEAQGEFSPEISLEYISPASPAPPTTLPTSPDIASETTRVDSPKTLAELNLPPRTLSEAGFLEQPVNPETAQNPPTTTPETTPTPGTTPTQETDDDDDDDNDNDNDNGDDTPPRVTPRVGAQFTTGPGVGFESSFGGFEGFIPIRQTPGQNLTFFEGRLLVSTDDAQLGGNVLVGYRTYNPDSDRTFGGYLGYDIRDTDENLFHQIGAGVETLGDIWEARANVYVPVGDNRQEAGESVSDAVVSQFAQPTFIGNSLASGQRLRQTTRRLEAALTGFDVEGGVRIIPIGETGDVRGYAGLYFYDGPGTGSFVGGRFRVEARPTDTLRAGISLETDDNFGTRLLLSVGANFPGTRPRGVNPEQRGLARLGESVVRNVNIALDEQFEFTSELQPIALINPATNEEYRFVHVNLGGTGGSGTFESPAGTVDQALGVTEEGDIVYVQSGTNPGIPAFTIPEDVRVMSSGPVQVIPTAIGNVQLPQSGSGVLPVVTGTVTLNNNSTLVGFDFNGTQGPAIQGTGISNVTIQNNIIRNAVTANPSSLGYGVFLTDVTGTINVTGNTFTDNEETGINVTSNRDRIELIFTGNQFANNNNAISYDMAGTAVGTVQITGNTITNSGRVDIQVRENSVVENSTISNNTINGAASQGINFETFDNAQSTITISGNTIQNVTGDGIFTGDGIRFGFNQNSRNQLTISGNTIITVADDGIDFDLFDSAQVTANVTGNRISGANSQGVGFANYGLEIDADNNSQLQLLLESNIISASAEQGVSIFAGAAGGTSRIFTTIRANTLTGNNVLGFATGGFEAQTFNGSTICVRLQNNASDTYSLINNGGTFQVEAGTNTGTVTQVGTTVAPPFTGCTVP